MNDQPEVCPKCGGGLAYLQDGIASCSACGYEGEAKKPDPKSFSTASKITFWIALLMPAFLALTSFLLGQVSEKMRDFGAGVGFVGLFVNIAASVYCSSWLAKRFVRPGPARVLAGTGLFLGIGLLNFIAIFAGCAGNVKID